MGTHHMKFSEVQNSYSLYVGLGSACDPALGLRRFGLRRFSMPFDWCVTNTIDHVTRVLRNRFADYMKIENLVVEQDQSHYYLDDGNPVTVEQKSIASHFVRDTLYDVLSVHDFPIISDGSWQLMYPTFRRKLDERIERLLTTLAASPSVLFVRWAGTVDHALALQPVLRDLTGGTAHLLVLRAVGDGEDVPIRDLEVDAEGVCVVQVPNRPGDAALWDMALSGRSLQP